MTGPQKAWAAKKVLAEVLSAMAESGGLAEEERKGSAGGSNDDESDIRGNSSASAVIRASDSTSFSSSPACGEQRS